MQMSISRLAVMSCCLFVSTFACAAFESNTPSREEVQRLSNAYYQVKNYYVESTDDKKLFEGAIRGMLNSLDPHSVYLDEEDLKELKVATEGEFGGVGLEILPEDGYIKVVSPIDDSPAQRAGIKPGDVIIRINGTPVKNLSTREAVEKMRGPSGTDVNLTIFRKSDSRLFKLKLTREIIHAQSVKSRMLEDSFGYVRISLFQEQTGPDLTKALAALNKQANGTLKGLILDLRNNPGGLLDAAVEVTDDFLTKNNNKGKPNLIVYTKGRLEGSQFEAFASGDDLLKGAPMVVLINEGSASGSEIVAGALQDHKRALIVGNTSFGKGSVQTVLPIDEKSAIKLTTALYYTPSGRSIQAKGILPDITIKDLKINTHANKNKYDMAIGSLKEVDLDGHLANGKGVKQPQTKTITLTAPPPDDSNLASSDYQLYEALQILKTVAFNRKQGS